MTRPLRTAEIFDAATDDGLFASLSARFATSLGARSGVIHWHHADDEQDEEVSYCGYFSAGQMDEYARHFANDDLWVQAIHAPAAFGQIWNCSALVPPQTFQNSRIYNEWIRPMGDDSFHCLGGVIRAGSVLAQVGFHRGRTQAAFGLAEVQALKGSVDQLRQLFTIRHKLRAAARAEASLSAAQDAIGYGIIAFAANGRIIHHNQTAEDILRRGDGLVSHHGTLQAVTPSGQRMLAAAIEAAAACEHTPGAFVIPRRGGGFYEVSLVSSWAGTRRQLQAVVHDPALADGSRPARLRNLYGLTVAEAEVAIALECASVAELALSRGTSVETIRSQVKAIASKLGCSRQSEIVAITCNLPKLGLQHRPGI